MANNPNDWSHFFSNQNQSFFTTTIAGDSRLSPETGRVAKPSRRRPRASRRTPTTLLNTDTANFRAMVQQFTGGPSAVASGSGSGFTPAPPSAYPSLGIGGGSSHAPPSWQYTFQQQVAHAPSQQQTRPYMFSLSDANPNSVMGGVNANAAVPGGFPTEDNGGGGSAPASEVIGSSRNVNGSSSWMQ